MDINEKYTSWLIAHLEYRNEEVVRNIDKDRENHNDFCAAYSEGYSDALKMVLGLLR